MQDPDHRALVPAATGASTLSLTGNRVVRGKRPNGAHDGNRAAGTLVATGCMDQTPLAPENHRYAAVHAGVFAVYFWLLRHPMFPVTLMPVTRLDRWITFQPWSIVLYASLWVYVSLPPMLLRPWRELLIYASTAMLVSMAGFAMFFSGRPRCRSRILTGCATRQSRF